MDLRHGRTTIWHLLAGLRQLLLARRASLAITTGAGFRSRDRRRCLQLVAGSVAGCQPATVLQIAGSESSFPYGASAWRRGQLALGGPER